MCGGVTPTRQRRFLSTLLVMALFIWVVFCHQPGAVSARLFPENLIPEETHVGGGGGSKEKLLRKYFNGMRGFEDNKRTVPSCPDPLHN
ncbi:CLAVATA3/ESR (CLE)-related protein 27, partial [Cucurbita argyrosperma subsp. argyrosperma]